MAVMLAFIAGIAAFSAIYLSRQRLAAKPWLEVDLAGELDDASLPTVPAVKVGLGVFLAVASSLFALLISAYFMRMELPDWRPLPNLKILWLNTIFLVAASLALQGAVAAARRGQDFGAKFGLAAGGILTLAFTAGQILAWHWLVAGGYPIGPDPATAFFFLMTGLHGLHVLGGLVALGWTFEKAWRAAKLDEWRENLELCALYWHFLLIVWLILLAVLTGAADDFAAFCRGLLRS
jgi:cytochrome c oxidase subunit 3